MVDSRRRWIWRPRAPRFMLAVAALLALAGILLSACGTSSRTLSTTAHAATATNPAAPSAMGQMSGGAGSMDGSSSGSGSGASGAAAASGRPVDGVTPIPTQTLGSADWQHMEIMAQARTAVPFVVDDGTSEKMVKPSSRTSFHLMVMLTDDRTNYTIPYASVWATIRRGSRIVFDERQWPMISEYMGPHYGNK